MTATQTATKATADPLAEAQLDQEDADATVARLTAKIAELRRSGPGFDQILHARLKVELESAFQKLRRVELVNAEQVAAAGSPILPGVLKKIRLRRHKVEDMHASVLARMAEAQQLREHLGSVKGEISALKASWEFREAQRQIRTTYIFPPNAQTTDPAAPARDGQKTPKSMEHLARLERDVETTGAELRIAVAAQEAASQRWQVEKAVLDNWERAARAMGPGARAVLASLPQPGAATSRPPPGQSSPLIR